MLRKGRTGMSLAPRVLTNPLLAASSPEPVTVFSQHNPTNRLEVELPRQIRAMWTQGMEKASSFLASKKPKETVRLLTELLMKNSKSIQQYMGPKNDNPNPDSSESRRLDIGQQHIKVFAGAAYCLRSSAFLHLGYYKYAVRDATLAHLLNPKDDVSLSNRSFAHCCLKNYEQAGRDADHALVLNPKNAAALGNRSSAYLFFGRAEPALRDAEACLRLDPHNSAAIKNLQLALNMLEQRRNLRAESSRSATPAGSRPPSSGFFVTGVGLEDGASPWGWSYAMEGNTNLPADTPTVPKSRSGSSVSVYDPKKEHLRSLATTPKLTPRQSHNPYRPTRDSLVLIARPLSRSSAAPSSSPRAASNDRPSTSHNSKSPRESTSHQRGRSFNPAQDFASSPPSAPRHARGVSFSSNQNKSLNSKIHDNRLLEAPSWASESLTQTFEQPSQQPEQQTKQHSVDPSPPPAKQTPNRPAPATAPSHPAALSEVMSLKNKKAGHSSFLDEEYWNRTFASQYSVSDEHSSNLNSQSPDLRYDALVQQLTRSFDAATALTAAQQQPNAPEQKMVTVVLSEQLDKNTWVKGTALQPRRPPNLPKQRETPNFTVKTQKNTALRESERWPARPASVWAQNSRVKTAEFRDVSQYSSKFDHLQNNPKAQRLPATARGRPKSKVVHTIRDSFPAKKLGNFQDLGLMGLRASLTARAKSTN